MDAVSAEPSLLLGVGGAELQRVSEFTHVWLAELVFHFVCVEGRVTSELVTFSWRNVTSGQVLILMLDAMCSPVASILKQRPDVCVHLAQQVGRSLQVLHNPTQQTSHHPF